MEKQRSPRHHDTEATEEREDDRRHRRERGTHKREHRKHHSARDDPEHRHSRSVRSRSRSRSPSRSKRYHSSHRKDDRRRDDRDVSTSSSESDARRREKRRDEKRRSRRDNDESFDGEDERRRRRRRSETSEERYERKQRRKEKEQRKKRSSGAGAIMEYGKHGIISETDVTSRLTSEFRQWLVEERHINPETISRAAEKKEMASFIEDFNTATMPSEKYYNLEAHERRMAMIRAGETVEEDGGYDPLADEKAAKASFKAQRRKDESSKSTPTQWQSKEQLEALRRVQMERIEAAKMKQLGLQTSANMGVRMDGTEFDRR